MLALAESFHHIVMLIVNSFLYNIICIVLCRSTFGDPAADCSWKDDPAYCHQINSAISRDAQSGDTKLRVSFGLGCFYLFILLHFGTCWIYLMGAIQSQVAHHSMKFLPCIATSLPFTYLPLFLSVFSVSICLIIIWWSVSIWVIIIWSQILISRGNYWFEVGIFR